MSRWIEQKKKPVLPLYLAALVWPVVAVLTPIYQLSGILLAAGLSCLVYAVAAKLCPTRVVRTPVAFDTGSADVDNLLRGVAANLDALHQLNEDIPDPALSDAISRMEKAGRSIAAAVEQTPSKAGQIDRFARYYLPELVKILGAYALMEKQGVQGENAAQILNQVRANAATMATAFENQLDALYAAEAMDVSTDIEVLDSILKSQNLAK